MHVIVFSSGGNTGDGRGGDTGDVNNDIQSRTVTWKTLLGVDGTQAEGITVSPHELINELAAVFL